MYKNVDFRSPYHLVSDQDDDQVCDGRTYVLLQATKTVRFHWGEANWVPWTQLMPTLEAKLPVGMQRGLGDVSIGLNADVLIDAQGDEEAVSWICQQLLNREVVQPGAPVSTVEPSGRVVERGAIETLAEPVRSLAFA